MRGLNSKRQLVKYLIGIVKIQSSASFLMKRKSLTCTGIAQNFHRQSDKEFTIFEIYFSLYKK